MSIDRIHSTASTSSLMNLDERLSRELGGDSGAEIAALLLLGARESRDQAQALRRAEEQRLIQFEQAEVDKLYDQAEALRAGGLSRGLGMMVSGAAGACGAMTSSPAALAVLGGSSKIAEGVGTLAGAYQDGLAKEAEADATAARNSAKRAERAISDLNQTESEASELQRTAIATASALVQTEAQGDQATLYLRG